ncbi:MAG: hypothetical protein AB7V26_06310 [Lysobacterales bacterium]
MRPVLCAVLFTLLGVFAADAGAHRRDLVDLQVIDRDSGAVLPVYHARGRSYVAGEPGHRYSVRLQNRSASRVLTVLSVDGVNAVSGESATPNQAGYVLAAYQSTEINGWRKSLDEVAQFVFSAPDESYAARTGRPQNVGVIGIAVYREEMVRPHAEVLQERRNPSKRGQAADVGAAGRAETGVPASPAPALSAERERDARAAEQYSELGTGHGEREWSPVASTEFRRASASPEQIVELHYDTARHLAERGVIPRPRSYPKQAPRAFAGGFVADPE